MEFSNAQPTLDHSADFTDVLNISIYADYEKLSQKQVAFLKIYVANPELKEVYKKHIQTHNDKVINNVYSDYGFDLFCPEEVGVYSDVSETTFLNFSIKTEMFVYENNKCSPVGFYLFPRSSISKTPLMLANSIGLIDAGYRGNLMAGVRAFGFHRIEKMTRLFQLVHSTTMPIYATLVDFETDLTNTERNEGGFGSTGK